MTILVNVNIQFVDESGKPYAAGLYYFGDPDVDPVANPKAVFSDPDLQIELPNPQVLDARGAFQQPVYRPSSDYSHKLDDVLFNQIFLVSNDSGQAATPSDRIQDNAFDTTILDEMGEAGLILTSLNSPGTQVLHNTNPFIEGTDTDTIIYDTTGTVIVFNASQTLTIIGSTVSNLKPLRITASDLKIFAPGALDAEHSLEINSGQTNLGTDGNLNALEITDLRVRIVSPDNANAFESIDESTKLGVASHPFAFEINATDVIIKNPLGGSGTVAIEVIDGATRISANTNVNAIQVLTGSTTIDTAGALNLTANNNIVMTSDNITLDAGGLLSLLTGGLRINGGSDTMDFFEYGNWTPTWQDESFSDGEGQTYAFNRGSYVRIGKLVLLEGELQITSVGSMVLANDVFLAGLPFPIASGSNQGFGLNVNSASDFSFIVRTSLTLVGSSGNSRCQLAFWELSGGNTILTAAPSITVLNTGSPILGFSGFYFI